ncbi:mechanosensitive ion channel family protein [Pseudoroseicyclus tamaricis]|uniref:Mechanosensitive ion channel family protein n=1 Tax=Pseudoroseicyclus tamaricis TaxID=2705421 RepID=A0A6B2JKZ1_9RHOB|nr:mechanosensitive ion channel family protein [Pseudoroseicyclus tamaricis]NDV02183.1 mechanosensitive ion channel family protein [Pseudoroseicyclus tamaricis]
MGEIEQALGDIEAYVPSSVWPWLIVLLGLLAGWFAHGFVWGALRRALRHRNGLGHRLIEKVRRPARLGFIIAFATIFAQAANLDDTFQYWLAKAAVAVLIMIVGWMVLIAIDVFVERANANLALDAEDNLNARKQATQMRVLQQAGKIVVVLVTLASVLATFETVRQYGVSLFASAGAAGLVLGFAARPVLANLIAGIQIALTQPIRIDDVVIVEGEWGWIEEIASTYVVVRIWDLRRLIVPLSKFIEEPFQNWTRENANIIGTVFWYLDWTAPIGAMREKLKELAEASQYWDGKVVNLQVTETDKDVITVRALLSARNSPTAWDLRCEIREKMVAWLQEAHPSALPKVRGELTMKEKVDAVSSLSPKQGDAEAGGGVPSDAVPASEGGTAKPVEE